jgi:hypothetical protein
MAVLTLRHCEVLGDWYVIELAEHDGKQWLERTGQNISALRCSSRLSDADIEGTAEQMLSIAEAIEARGSAHHRRCAVSVYGDRVTLCSPRNSQRDGVCTLAEADALAALIRATFTTPVSP